MFIATQFLIAKCWKQAVWSSTDEWIKKMGHLYTMEHYCAIKKVKESFVGEQMHSETIVFSETNQTQKLKHHMAYLF